MRLIVQLFIENGFALAATSTALVITAACTPATNIWMVIAFPLGNIYIVSVLITVTARRGIQEGEKEQKEKQSSEMGLSNNPDIQSKLTSRHATRMAAMVQLELISIDKTPEFLKEDAFMAARRIPQQMKATQGKDFHDTSNETNYSSSLAETEGNVSHPARAANSLSISKGDERRKPGSTVVSMTTETTLDSYPERTRPNHRAEASNGPQGLLKVQGKYLQQHIEPHETTSITFAKVAIQAKPLILRHCGRCIKQVHGLFGGVILLPRSVPRPDRRTS